VIDDCGILTRVRAHASAAEGALEVNGPPPSKIPNQSRSRLIAYAHSIDFGAKGCDNLAGLAALQRHAAGQLRRPVGRLIMMVKPAHAYKTERSYVLADPEAAAGSGQPPDGNGQRGEP